MKKITVNDVRELPLPERIQLVEDIWDTIAIETASNELTKNEKRLIDRRLENHQNDSDAGLPWNDVYKKITANA